MVIVVLKEAHPRETRVAMIPEYISRLVKGGAQMRVEAGAGQSLNISDEAYAAAGASLVTDRKSLLQEADLVRASAQSPEKRCPYSRMILSASA